MLCWFKICTLIGTAIVTDGDTLRIRGQAIRLWGIDAPELSEPYGATSREALSSIVGQREVQCWPSGAKSYNRIVATCFVGDVDIGAEMVRRGLALDCAHYSKGYYKSLEPSDSRKKLQQKPYC